MNASPSPLWRVGRALRGAVLLLAMGMALPTQAAEDTSSCPAPAPLELQQDPQWIHRGLQVLFDARPGHRLEEVLAPPLCQQFRVVPGPADFGYRAPAVWLRFGLQQRVRDEPGWRVLVLFGQLDRVCLHWPVSAAPQYRSECADHRQPMNRGTRTSQGWYFAVPADLDATRPVLLHAQGGATIRVQLALGTADAFVHHLYLRQSWLGTFYGLMLGVVLFGLVTYLAQRDRTHLYFSATIALFTLFVAVEGGHGSPLGLVGTLVNRLSTPLVALNIVMGTLFYRRFLETGKYVRRLHRVLLVVALLYVVPSLLEAVLPNSITVPSRIAFGLLWLLLLLAMVLVRLRQGSRSAIYVLLAWSCFGSAGILTALNAAGIVLMSPQFLTLAYCAGDFLLSLLLAIGLLDRMRNLGHERDQARELASSSQQLALYRAHYDPVTHLPNRTRFREFLQERLQQRSPEQRYALVTMGLDRFGQLRDAMGRDIGDSVLAEIAQRLRAELRSEHGLARVGPDLFAWLAELPAGAAIEPVCAHCEALQQAITAPLHLASGARLSASTGIALYPQHGSNAELLLQHSEAALHRARIRGAGSLQLFEPHLQLGITPSVELDEALSQALAQNQLKPVYQPIVSLGDGRLLGVEASVRWTAPDGHPVALDQIVPLIHTVDLLRTLTEWQLHSYRRQLADWQSRGVAIPYVSFNLSAPQLCLPGVEPLIANPMGTAGSPVDRIVVEVPEGNLLDNLEDTVGPLQRLRQQRIRVAIDNFGAGHGSPEYLRTLPVDMLKIDPVFLRDVPQDHEADTVLAGLITIAESLELDIVALGVDTDAQRQYLASHRVSGGQGSLFGGALPAADFEIWLHAHRLRAA